MMRFGLCVPNLRLCSINFGCAVARERNGEGKREDESDTFFNLSLVLYSKS